MNFAVCLNFSLPQKCSKNPQALALEDMEYDNIFYFIFWYWKEQLRHYLKKKISFCVPLNKENNKVNNTILN